MIDIFKLILQIAIMYVPRAIKKAEDREYVQKLLDAALSHYQGTALDPAEVRRASADLDAELEKKWRARFGSSGTRPPGGA